MNRPIIEMPHVGDWIRRVTNQGAVVGVAGTTMTVYASDPVRTLCTQTIIPE